MTKRDTRSPDKPRELPQSGGSYIRQATGKLVRAAPAPEAAAPVKPQAPAEQPDAPATQQQEG